MSKVEEFYRRVISIACEVCGVDPIMMFSCKREKYVDARNLVIMNLTMKGYTDTVISELTGLTYSNYRSRESVMVIGRTSSYREFSNSLFHECRHLTDHMAIALNMDVGGEEIAYLSGYIGGKLAPDIQLFICDCNCHKNEINRHIYQQKKENGNKSRFKN